MRAPGSTRMSAHACAIPLESVQWIVNTDKQVTVPSHAMHYVLDNHLATLLLMLRLYNMSAHFDYFNIVKRTEELSHNK